ncbi:MAG: alpha/beta hydrolase [Chloroflexi bacterium]|nr:alpha/beta hydrolase [Chloroflexota bacterium]
MALLLLHGALGAAADFDSLLPLLDMEDVYTFDFEGHGTQALPEGPFSIEQFANNVVMFMNDNDLEWIDIFGYSMGGYVALFLASEYPLRVGKIMTLATKFHWTPEAAAQETRLLDADKIQEKVPQYAGALAQLHGDTWKDMLAATAEMIHHLGAAPPLTDERLQTIKNPVRVSLGDRDKMVTLDETVHVYQQLSNAEFQVFPSTPHPINQVAMPVLAEAINTYFS